MSFICFPIEATIFRGKQGTITENGIRTRTEIIDMKQIRKKIERERRKRGGKRERERGRKRRIDDRYAPHNQCTGLKSSETSRYIILVKYLATYRKSRL